MIMKRYRILCLDEPISVVNVRVGNGPLWSGYTERETAQEDLGKLQVKHPDKKFVVAEYIELSV